MQRKFKRRNYYIDKGVQTRFIAGFAGVSILGGIVAVLCFWYLSHQKLEATLYSMRLPQAPMGSILLEEMLFTSAVSVVFVLALFVYTARKVFARIDGPLGKMAGAVRNIARGDLKSEVKLRGNDEFQDFAQEVDSMVCHLNKKFSVIRDTSAEIIELCQSPREEQVRGSQLKAHLDALRQELQAVNV